MATKLYPGYTASPPVTPATLVPTGWTQSGSGAPSVYLASVTQISQGASLARNGVASPSPAFIPTQWHILNDRIGVNNFNGNSVIGYIKGSESNAGLNATLAFAIYELDSGGNILNTIVPISASDNTAAAPPEFGTTASSRQITDSAESASVACNNVTSTNGSYIGILFGYRQGATSTSRNASVNTGSIGTDFSSEGQTSGVSWLQFQTTLNWYSAGPTPTRGRVSQGTIETPNVATRGRVSQGAIEFPQVVTRGRLSWAEIEVPIALTRGRVSWAEIETPPKPTRGQVSQLSFEAPGALTRGEVSWATFEVPIAATRGRVSQAAVETPSLTTRGEVSWAAVEVPFKATRGEVSQASVEFPFAPTRGEVSQASIEVPIALTRGRVSWGEIEVPTLSLNPTRGRVSQVQIEVPNAATRGKVSFAAIEAPFAQTRGEVSQAYLETPQALTRGHVSFAAIESPIAPTRGRVAQAYFYCPSIGGGEYEGCNQVAFQAPIGIAIISGS